MWQVFCPLFRLVLADRFVTSLFFKCRAKKVSISTRKRKIKRAIFEYSNIKRPDRFLSLQVYAKEKKIYYDLLYTLKYRCAIAPWKIILFVLKRYANKHTKSSAQKHSKCRIKIKLDLYIEYICMLLRVINHSNVYTLKHTDHRLQQLQKFLLYLSQIAYQNMMYTRIALYEDKERK